LRLSFSDYFFRVNQQFSPQYQAILDVQGNNFALSTPNGSGLGLNYRILFEDKKESLMLLVQLEKLEKHLAY